MPDLTKVQVLTEESNLAATTQKDSTSSSQLKS